ncbi:hypothetical protein [Denitromonas iodatirespirans]|uniref:Uncharacterized protein n=1 Tax=Denitromonas iodatirespirans TaxID=2795389 RepID=A0A944DCP7_DENI1|nr:hypothetical protein [Denitromonas iodatirespirans]MBT0962053.1 hypothetical protein [Denitromonas iodatirespirans]
MHTDTNRTRKTPPKREQSRPLSERSRWAYFMHGMNPDDTDAAAVARIGAAFGPEHPAWIVASRPGQEATSGRFRHMRKYVLQLTRQQAAVYLRVSPRTIAAWETDASAVPFSAYEALRLLSESPEFRLSHRRWDGWFVNPQSGGLVSPDRGRLAVTPEEINGLPQLYAQREFHRSEADRLKRELAEAIAENTRLRELFLSDGVTDQLRGMHDQLSGLLGRIGTAKVLEFPSANHAIHSQAKVAAQ